jgi:hypothetical protein
MSVTSATYFQSENIDTRTTTGMIIGQTNANAITIGSSNPGRTPSIVIDTQSTLNTQAAPAIAIGTSASAKTIKIGNSTNTVVVAALTFGAETINNFTGVTGTGNIAIGNLMTSGSIGIGNSSSRTGQINIGAGATASGQINIGSAGSSIVNIIIGNGGTGSTGTIQLGGLNIATGIVGNLSLGSNITLATLANDSTVLNTITNATTNQTVTLTRAGQTYFLYRSTNSGTIPNVTNTVLLSTTVANAGIYTVCYHARYSASNATTKGQGVQTWIYVSSPATYGGGGFGQLALNLVGYVSPFLDLQAVGVAMSSSWTGLINAGASVQLTTYIQYSGTTNGFMIGGAGSNYLSITRIA